MNEPGETLIGSLDRGCTSPEEQPNPDPTRNDGLALQPASNNDQDNEIVIYF